jgi:hypothetical protein
MVTLGGFIVEFSLCPFDVGCGLIDMAPLEAAVRFPSVSAGVPDHLSGRILFDKPQQNQEI